MPYTANSFYEPGRMTTETSSPGLQLGALPGGMDPQLMSLLGPAFQQKAAMAQQKAAQEARMQALAEQEAQMRLAQMKMQSRTALQGSGPSLSIGRADPEGFDTSAGPEHSFVQNVGGAQMTPGLIRSYSGTPGAVYGGYTVGAQPKGGPSITNKEQAPQGQSADGQKAVPQSTFSDLARFQNLNQAAENALIDANSANYGNSSVRASNARYYGRNSE